MKKILNLKNLKNYRDFSYFSSECFKDDSAFVGKNMITQISIKKIVDTHIINPCQKKIKTFRGNQKHHINKTLCKAIMKR